MKKFAVGVFKSSSDSLNIEIITADDWHSALLQHTSLKGYILPSSSVREAKREASYFGSYIDIVEIP